MPEKFKSLFKLSVQIFLSLILCYAEIVLLDKLKSKTEFSPELILAVCTIAITLTLILNVDNLKSLSIGALKAELEIIRDKIDESKQELYDLITLSMGGYAYTNLLKFTNPRGFEDYILIIGEGLYTELYHLRNIGYVDLKKGIYVDGKEIKSIKDLPPKGDNLSDYIQITDMGKKYLELRKKVRWAS